MDQRGHGADGQGSGRPPRTPTDDAEIQRHEQQRRDRREHVRLPDAPAVRDRPRIHREQQARDQTHHRTKSAPAQPHRRGNAADVEQRDNCRRDRRVARQREHRRQQVDELGRRIEAHGRQRSAERHVSETHHVLGEMKQNRLIRLENREVEVPKTQAESQAEDQRRGHAQRVAPRRRSGSAKPRSLAGGVFAGADEGDGVQNQGLGRTRP